MRCQVSRYSETGRAAFSASRSVRLLQSGHVQGTNPPAKSDPGLCTAKSWENRTDSVAGSGRSWGNVSAPPVLAAILLLGPSPPACPVDRGPPSGLGAGGKRCPGLMAFVREVAFGKFGLPISSSPRQSWLVSVSKCQAVSTSRRWRQGEKAL